MTSTTDLFELLKEAIPDDHSEQVDSKYFVEQLYKEPGRTALKVLDLGCGRGESFNFFKSHDAEVDWHGVDLESSPEVDGRTLSNQQFHSFDGVALPFESAVFDIVYSNQVFEHVRHPQELMQELARVLKPGGAFIGSVSYLEPYHSLSFWNFTPYGWFTLLKESGLRPLQLRPGIDSIALIQRQYLGRPQYAKEWFLKSPLNEEIDSWGVETRRRPALINLRKLQFCGHLVFYASRPDDPAGSG